MNPNNNQTPQPQPPVQPQPHLNGTSPQVGAGFATAPVQSAQQPTASQPSNPPQPVAGQPFVGQPVTPPQRSPKSSKKLVIILISVFAALLVVGGAVATAAYFMMTAVTQEDYQEAAEIVEKMHGKGSASYLSVGTLSSIDARNSKEFAGEAATQADKSLKEYEAENDKLAQSGALNDPEVAEAYKVYRQSYEEYVAYAKSYIPAAEKVLVASARCGEVMHHIGDADAYQQGVASCLFDFQTLDSEVQDENLRQFIDAMIENTSTTLLLMEEARAMSPYDQAGRVSVSERSRTSDEKFQSQHLEVNAKLKKKVASLNVAPAHKEFAAMISKKAEGTE